MKTATAIGLIFTNAAANTEFKTGMIKTDVSDHFSILLSTNFQIEVDPKAELQYLFKCFISKNSIEQKVEWYDIKASNDVNNTYPKHLNIIWLLYDECFPKKEVKTKTIL